MTQSSDNEAANALTKSHDTQKILGKNFLEPINFKQAVVLRQSPYWLRAVVWTGE